MRVKMLLAPGLGLGTAAVFSWDTEVLLFQTTEFTSGSDALENSSLSKPSVQVPPAPPKWKQISNFAESNLAPFGAYDMSSH